MGKTEALAIFCVLFNRSDSFIDFQRSMAFRGLGQAGACSCYDEFNPIKVGVLSVIAGQFNCVILRCARLGLSPKLCLLLSYRN
jgi:hypothetical protein